MTYLAAPPSDLFESVPNWGRRLWAWLHPPRLEVQLSRHLSGLRSDWVTHQRLSNIRTHLEREFARTFPAIRMTVNLELPDPTYRLVPKYGGASVEGSIAMGRCAAFGPLDKLETLPGEPYWERSRSMPGRLLELKDLSDCEMAGCLYFYPRELLAFHITEFLRAPVCGPSLQYSAGSKHELVCILTSLLDEQVAQWTVGGRFKAWEAVVLRNALADLRDGKVVDPAPVGLAD